MRLDLRPILHVPGASAPFSFQLDLSELDFYGVRPFTGPVQVTGQVRNRADALVLTGAAAAVLDLQCDRCLKPFQRELRVPVECLLAEELEDACQRGELRLEHPALAASYLLHGQIGLLGEHAVPLEERVALLRRYAGRILEPEY